MSRHPVGPGQMPIAILRAKQHLDGRLFADDAIDHDRLPEPPVGKREEHCRIATLGDHPAGRRGWIAAMRDKQFGAAGNRKTIVPDQTQGSSAIGSRHCRTAACLDLAGRILAVVTVTHRAQERRALTAAFNTAALTAHDGRSAHAPPTRLTTAPCGSSAWTIQSSPGTCMGPLITVPPLASIAPLAAAMLGTQK